MFQTHKKISEYRFRECFSLVNLEEDEDEDEEEEEEY